MTNRTSISNNDTKINDEKIQQKSTKTISIAIDSIDHRLSKSRLMMYDYKFTAQLEKAIEKNFHLKHLKEQIRVHFNNITLFSEAKKFLAKLKFNFTRLPSLSKSNFH